MSADSQDIAEWFNYARDNLQVAEMALDSGLFNPCLQNAQQTVEKELKAIRISRKMGLKRTHSITDLNVDLLAAGVDVQLSSADCELFDSIYVGSKYPDQSVLPNSPPDSATCRKCVELARRVLDSAERITG
jgi:HEPN domain-containing protein